jgi:hypothetical protein
MSAELTRLINNRVKIILGGWDLRILWCFFRTGLSPTIAACSAV